MNNQSTAGLATVNKRTSGSPDGSAQTADAASDVRIPVNRNGVIRGE